VDAIGRRFEESAQESDGRTLAVGAGDMHHRRQLVLGVAEIGQQPLDALKREIDQFRVER
jgi:hypothetical protein